MVFATEEVANAYVDKFHPEWDENDYRVHNVRLIEHIDDV
jgi:hypothetical protein